MTFLFTDLEGSTRLWEAHPTAMRAALARHDALIEATVVQHGGVVVRPRGEGDSRFAVFARATDAVAAASGIQGALHAEPWPPETPLRVRLALHTGEADLRAGDYYGSAVNRAARLRGIAHGGQTLLSQATHDLVRDALPAGVAVRDLGVHRLSDLARPERVFQLLAPDFPADFPPLRTLDTLPNNLPLQLTSFVGREQEAADVRRLLRAGRLLTLTGPGGTGKTRLALQVAADVLEDFPDGVWLAALGALADPALVPQAVAAAVGVREEPGRPLVATLPDALRPRRLLVVLDNCEHLLDACARLADALLRACPQLRVLATSREALGIAGETAWRVPSLGVPGDADVQQGPGALGVERSAAVRLFAERAAAVRPEFALTAETAAAVAQVCARLDGIPLAIELAAARVRVLPPRQLLARLDDRFRLLTGGSRTALERHQTLRAAVDWSYDLLSEPERTLFARLSVFAGGMTLEGGEAVGAGDGIAAEAVLDLLTRLADKSLVVAEEQPDGTARYRLLETLRQYGGERLAAGGAGATDAVRERHAAHYLAVAEAVQRRAGDWPTGRFLTQYHGLAREHDNLRAALAWWLAAGRAEPALRLAVALGHFWEVRGLYGEGRRWLEAGLAAGGGAPLELRAAALNRAGLLAQWQGDYARARALHEASIAHWREVGDEVRAAEAQQSLAADVWQEGDAGRAAALMEADLAFFRGRGLPAGVSRSLRDLGLVARSQQQYARAAALFAESVDQARAAGIGGWVARGLSHLGRVAYLQGDHRLAATRLAEALTMMQQSGAGHGRGHHALADCLEWTAAVAAAARQPARAARLFGAAEALRVASGIPRYAPERGAYDRDVAATRDQLDGRTFVAAWAEGRAMTPAQAVAYALAENTDIV